MKSIITDMVLHYESFSIQVTKKSLIHLVQAEIPVPVPADTFNLHMQNLLKTFEECIDFLSINMTAALDVFR